MCPHAPGRCKATAYRYNKGFNAKIAVFPVSRSIKDSAAWAALQEHCAQIGQTRTIHLLNQDAGRFAAFSARLGHLFFDYSKHRITHRTLQLLTALAREAELGHWRECLARGTMMNTSENRAVLHPLLRTRASGQLSREKAFAFVRQVRSGQVKGASGKPLRHIVSIGIGGSYTGNKMLCRALAAFGSDSLAVHFIDVGDRDQSQALLASLPPEETLFLAVSKSFTTAETRASIRHVCAWLNACYRDDHSWRKHLAAVSANQEALVAVGILPERQFVIADGIGGRYSIWSTASLPAMIFIGVENFKQFLAGAGAMDRHFFQQPFDSNIPVILGLTHFWYVSFCGCGARAILVYDSALKHLPAYLQQLEMESNGKSVTRDGIACDYPTAPVVWGGQGLQAQHSFFQMLHQGRRLIPSDFIIAANTTCQDRCHERLLAANFFAQIHALSVGVESADPHKRNHGMQPSTAILLKEISPASVGALIAFYEHQIFVQAMLWQINPFDQWGVESGKQLAAQLAAVPENPDAPARVRTVAPLMHEYLRWKQ